MIVPGKKILEAKAVSELTNESQIQPAGVDLTLKEVHSFEDAGEIDFDNSKRRISKTKKLEWKEGKQGLDFGWEKSQRYDKSTNQVFNASFNPD